jgi:hypothetical protein
MCLEKVPKLVVPKKSPGRAFPPDCLLSPGGFYKPSLAVARTGLGKVKVEAINSSARENAVITMAAAEGM